MATDVLNVLVFEVKLNGQPLPYDAPLLTVRVDLEIGLPDRAVLRVHDYGLQFVDGPRSKVGTPVEVATAPDRTTQPTVIFKGVITAVEADLQVDGAIVEITAMHTASELQRRTGNRALRQVTAADAIKQVAGPAFATVTCPTPVYTMLHQAAESDWDFVRRLAAEHGAEIVTKAGDVHVQPIDHSPGRVAAVDSKDLLSFRARVTAARQVRAVEVKGWDPTAKAVVSGEHPVAPPLPGHKDLQTSAVSGGGGGRISLPRAVDKHDQARKLAEGMAQQLGRAAVEAELVVYGHPQYQPGSAVTVQGVGTRFGGTHRIVSAVHVLDPDVGYTTRMHLGSEPPVLGATTGAGRGLAATEGLMVGLVSSVGTGTEAGMVKLKLPVLGDAYETGWARVARGASGAERGGVATLHVNDEVVVGFELGDQARPVVLGALFNGRDKPGAILGDTSLSYAARYPKGVDVLTDDQAIVEADKGLTVGAKNGKVAVTAGNAIELKTTSGDLKLTSTGGTTVNANGQLQVKGATTVTIEASGQLVLQSNGQLQVKAPQIQLQGTAMVQVSAPQVMLG